MPLSKVSYPYVDTLRIPSLLAENSTVSGTNTVFGTSSFQYVESRNTVGASIANGESQVRSTSPDGNYDLRLWMRNDAGGFYYFNALGGSANVLRIAHSTTPRLVTQLTQDFTSGLSANYGGRVNIDSVLAGNIGLVVRGVALQSSSLQEWQNSAGSPTSIINSSGVFIAPAATTSIPSIRFPHGTAPSTPSDGDVWTTTAGMYVRINGSTVGPLAGGGTITNPMTTLGDLIYGGATGVATRLAGQTTNGTYFLRENVTASASVAPDWIGSTGSGNVVLATSPTVTTPVIDSISASAVTATTSLHPTVTTGSIAIGAGLTTGALNIATVGTGATPISIGHTNATLGITGNTTITGTLTTTSTVNINTTGIGTLNLGDGQIVKQSGQGFSFNSTINVNQPQIQSTNTGAASLFTSTVSSVTIGYSGITTTIDGNLTVNGTTTTINSSTLSVDDKNIEMGAVVAATVSTTGTVGSITGTGPWTATITGMTDTADLIVGSAITATNGTGSLGASGTYIVASIVSGTSITYTATGGTTPVAGTVTNITTTGATDTTANGGGIVLKGTTDKSILWDSTNANWTSTEHINLASTKVFKINNSQVLSATAVFGITPTTNATGFTLSGGTTAVAVTFAGGAAYTLSGTNGQTYTFPSATGTLITASSPTITTPTIDTINASASSTAANLWNTVIQTGSINMGGSLTSGGITLAGGGSFNGNITLANQSTSAHSILISNGAGTGNKTINVGTSSTGGTTAITLGSSSGATSTIQLNGAVTTSSTITTGGQLNLNYASPVIASNNASPASIFPGNVTGITIGSSTIKTTKYPVQASGTTSGLVTQSAQLSGFMGMPVNSQGSAGVALAYTLTASDAGKMIYVSSTPTTPTITIPANTAVAFEIGTTIVVMNDIGAATNVSIAITTDTLQLVSSGLTGTRTLARYGMATLVKVTATKWIITGNGVT